MRTKALEFLSFLSNTLSENIRIFPISPLSLTSKWESGKIALFQTSKLGQRARLALQLRGVLTLCFSLLSLRQRLRAPDEIKL